MSSVRSAATNLRLDWCSHKAASHAVRHWHYSKKLPAGKLVRIGVWEDGSFRGVVLFGTGVKREMLRQFGVDPEQGCELTRVALRSHRTHVTRIIRIALLMVKKQSPGLRLIVSFADPRHGHVGGIYQAGNWIYTGRSKAQILSFVNGQMMHARSLGKSVKEGRIVLGEDVKKITTPPKYRYLYPLDSQMRKQIERFRKPLPS